MTGAEDISLKCVCKRSLTLDGKCPKCSSRADDCVCDEDTGFSDNASDLQALAGGGGGEMGSIPQVWEITMMFNPCLLTRDKKRSCMYVYVCVHLRQHLVAAGIMTVEVMNSD